MEHNETSDNGENQTTNDGSDGTQTNTQNQRRSPRIHNGTNGPRPSPLAGKRKFPLPVISEEDGSPAIKQQRGNKGRFALRCRNKNCKRTWEGPQKKQLKQEFRAKIGRAVAFINLKITHEKECFEEKACRICHQLYTTNEQGIHDNCPKTCQDQDECAVDHVKTKDNQNIQLTWIQIDKFKRVCINEDCPSDSPGHIHVRQADNVQIDDYM